METPQPIMIRQAQSRSDFRSLWTLKKFEATRDGRPVGFILVSFIPSQAVTATRIDSDILAYLKVSTGRGRGIVPRSYTCLELAGDKMVESIEYGINELLHGWSHANQQKTRKATRLDRVSYVKEQLPWLIERFDPERQAFLAFHVDKPMVDMVEVNPDHRHQGVGLALYEKAAMWAREQQMSLHASRIQTPEAKAIWQSLTRRGLVEPDGQPIHNRAGYPRPRMR